MTGFKEYDKYDAMGLADLAGKKKVKPSELCEEAISRIEKHNPSLNAVIYKMYESAREAVKGKLPKGPFTGVPFLVKDALHRVAGVPYTVGSRSLKDYIPDRDSETVTRYRNAGLVILGKTNVPELTLTGFTEPELYGPCRNPGTEKEHPAVQAEVPRQQLQQGWFPQHPVMTAGAQSGYPQHSAASSA
jgi:amidase